MPRPALKLPLKPSVETPIEPPLRAVSPVAAKLDDAGPCLVRPVSAGDGSIAAALIQHFKFSTFRDGQIPVIEALLENRDVLAVMPTGAGKSLCFQLAALMKPGLAVIISPLIALMEDQTRALQAVDIDAAMIHSGRPREENIADWRRVKTGQAKILYMSPERLLTRRMQSALGKMMISMFVIDEAHCISQWGHDFRSEYLALASLKTSFPSSAIAAFTATADQSTRADIMAQLMGPDAFELVQGFERPNLTLTIRPKKKPMDQLCAFVERRRGQQGLVYTMSRKGAEKAADELQAAGHNAIAYHAGMSDTERQAQLHRFLTEPDLIVCATIAFGMGIDKPAIRYVLHMNIPACLEAYYQETGRAGRDGHPAEAMLLFGYQDVKIRRLQIEAATASLAVKAAQHQRLDQLIDYCETADDHAKKLIAYFNGNPGNDRSSGAVTDASLRENTTLIL